jgi:hypothetical protein
MNSALWLNLGVAALLVLSGCKREHSHAHDDGEHSHGGGHGHSHSDDAESFSGATHKEGKGITLLDETRKLLGIQTAEVRERMLPREIRFVARVYGSSPGEARSIANNSPADQLALGTVPAAEAALLRAGLPAQLQTRSGATVTGEVQRVTKPLVAGDSDSEVIVVFRSGNPIQSGEFAEVFVSVPGAKNALVVPQESIIRGATGDLVYVVNGDAYLLTWVTLGAQADGLVEATDGLLAGDSVVTRGVMDLWLIELRAMKGGQGCCPAPPAKGKK